MKSILIIDDEPDLTEALTALLEDEGFQVFVAGDGKSGLKSLYESKPNLVLLDVMMPYLDGYEVLKTIRSRPEYSSIPVILMSVSKPRPNQDDHPWQAFIAKPFDLETLLHTIKALAEAKAA